MFPRLLALLTAAVLASCGEVSSRPGSAAGRPGAPATLPPGGAFEIAGTAPGVAAPPREGPRVVEEQGPPFDFEVALELPSPDGPMNVMPGFALLDLEGDGDLDLLWPRGHAAPQLLRNDGGMTFTPVDAGLPTDLRTTLAALGDCDGDGDVDVLLAGVARWTLLRHEGEALVPVPDAGLNLDFVPGTPVFFDADGDGDQDLLVPSYQLGRTEKLLLNAGDCRFTDGTDRLEPRPPAELGATHGAAALDVNGDGATDLLLYEDVGYLAGPDRLLVNDGSGHFTDRAAEYGLDHAAFSMSAEVADLDGDGLLDVYKGNLCRNPFSRGQGPGLPFVDADAELGISDAWIEDPGSPPLVLESPEPGTPFWEYLRDYTSGRPDSPTSRCLVSWSTPTADLDADGWRELLVINGQVGLRPESSHQPAQLYWRSGGTGPFQDVARLARLRHAGQGRSAAFADLDGDARLDLVVGNLRWDRPSDQPSRVFRNLTPDFRMGHHLWLELTGPGANTQGIGAVVRVTAGGRTQIAYRTLGTSFLAASAAPLHFGLGTATSADVEVTWPWGGGVDRFPAVPAGGPVRLVHGTGR